MARPLGQHPDILSSRISGGMGGGAWAAPVGPLLWGGYWLPFAFMGLLIALILVAAAPAPRSTVEIADPEIERREARQTEVAFEIFFWILLIIMIMAIMSRYL